MPMKCKIQNAVRASLFLFLAAGFLPAFAQRQMENLGRGVVAVRTGEKSVFISWRMLNSDPQNIAFNIYRLTDNSKPVKLNSQPLSSVSWFIDDNADFSKQNAWYVTNNSDKAEVPAGRPFKLSSDVPQRQYISIPLEIPEGGEISGRRYSYSANDASAGDLDGDGKDEFCVGAMTVDDDGKGLYSTGLRHGDALHISDMDPTRPGLEVFGIHENEGKTIELKTPGAAMFDAKTGEIIFSVGPGADVGRGVAADIDPEHPGFENWGGPGGLRNVHGKTITEETPSSTNFVIWWDGDLTRELLDKNRIDKWDWESESTVNLLTAEGCVSNNGSKATPCLSADLFGDWREEVIWRTGDNSELRIYTTVIPTDYRFRSFMCDPQYRLSVAWQNVAYNQPPHPGFFFGVYFSDNFKNALDTNIWIPEVDPLPGSKVYTENNKLILDTKGGVTVWLNKLLKGDFIIEFDRKVVVADGKNDRLSDMNVFWMASDPRNQDLFTREGVLKQYDSLQLYYVGMGGNTNSTTRFRKYEGNGERTLLQEYTDTGHLLTPNKDYHIKIEVLNGTTSFWADGICYFTYNDPSPLREGYFGFRSTWSHQEISNFRVSSHR